MTNARNEKMTMRTEVSADEEDLSRIGDLTLTGKCGWRFSSVKKAPRTTRSTTVINKLYCTPKMQTGIQTCIQPARY